MCTATRTAEYFLRLQTGDASDAISNMKLQKLLYYAQGFALAILDAPLFQDDFEKWSYGPVIPAIYDRYKAYGSGAIPIPEGISSEDFTDGERRVLDEVYFAFGKYSAWALSDLSHQTPPWRDAELGQVITKDSMRRYFSTQVVA